MSDATAGRLTRARRGQSGADSWELVEGPPGAGLEGLVRAYVAFVETSPSPLRRREAPSGTAVRSSPSALPSRSARPEEQRSSTAGSFVARMSALPATTAFLGTSAGVQVDFTALGLHLFCDLAVDELHEPAVGLGELLGPGGWRLTEMLEDAPDWKTRFDLLDAAIAARFAAARPPAPSVVWAWRALEASGGRVEVGRLCERIGCGPRHLIAGFGEHVGVTPKTAACILRFDRAGRLMRGGDGESLARIAAECGYHDQAHMTQDFRALAGVTPSAHRVAALPGHLGVADPGDQEVNSLQDAPAAPA